MWTIVNLLLPHPVYLRCILLVLLPWGFWWLRIDSGDCVRASQRLFWYPLFHSGLRDRLGNFVSSSFLKRMKNTLDRHFLLLQLVWIQFDLAPFVLYRELSKHSSLVALKSVSGEKYFILLKKHKQIFFFRQKENCAIVLVPLTSWHQSDFILLELSVCLGNW